MQQKDTQRRLDMLHDQMTEDLKALAKGRRRVVVRLDYTPDLMIFTCFGNEIHQRPKHDNHAEIENNISCSFAHITHR